MQKQKWILVASLAAAVAACGGNGQPINTSLYSVNQPVVKRTNFVMDVNLNSNGITASEKVRLSQWMDALGIRYGDRISMDYGNGYRSAAADQDLSKLAADRGLLMNKSVPVTQGNVTPGTVRVIVTRSTASVPNCPDWDRSSETNFQSSTSDGYGCATNSNLAAMVADPEDLIRGKEADSDSNRSGNRAVEAYRNKTSGGN